jgi:hypothetical protein
MEKEVVVEARAARDGGATAESQVRVCRFGGDSSPTAIEKVGGGGERDGGETNGWQGVRRCGEAAVAPPQPWALGGARGGRDVGGAEEEPGDEEEEEPDGRIWWRR